MDNVAFTFGDSKEAALYFDHVIPLGLIFDVIEEHGPELFKKAETPEQIPWKEYYELRNTFQQLVPPGFQAWDDLAEINWGCIVKHVDVVPGVTSPVVAADAALRKAK